MRGENAKKLAEFDEKITDVEKNMGDEEVRDAMLAKADYLANIGDKEAAWEAYEAVEAKTPSVNHKLTISFCKMRLEILYGNWVAVKDLITTAKALCDKGGDWEKKNRLMVRCRCFESFCLRFCPLWDVRNVLSLSFCQVQEDDFQAVVGIYALAGV
jgi:26S proteasome regulatory subunit N7